MWNAFKLCYFLELVLWLNRNKGWITSNNMTLMSSVQICKCGRAMSDGDGSDCNSIL